MVYVTRYASPVGEIILAADGESLTGLWIEGQKYEGDLREASRTDDLPIFTEVKQWLDEYFLGDHPSPDRLPLAPSGSAFRQSVWKILLEIPYGEVTTYGAIAKEIARRHGKETMSAQVVGGAVGHNPISLIIPCHRVIGSGGNLTGYAGGLGIKMRLLEHEGVDMSGMYLPKKGTAV